jgi:prephenate dehydrogenase
VKIEKVGLVGYGRFGRMASGYLQKSKELLVYDREPQRLQGLAQAATFADTVSAPLIVLSVPTSEMTAVCKQMAPLLREGQIVVDTCSVKEKPITEMLTHLPESVQLLGTHPLFGPDSGEQGIGGLKIALCPVRIERAAYEAVRDYLKRLGLMVMETTPQEHDRQIARSQAIFHLIAQTIKELQWAGQAISTPGPEGFYRLIESVQHDTDQLFFDMERGNPYAADCRDQFIRAMTKIHEDLLENLENRLAPE